MALTHSFYANDLTAGIGGTVTSIPFGDLVMARASGATSIGVAARGAGKVLKWSADARFTASAAALNAPATFHIVAGSAAPEWALFQCDNGRQFRVENEGGSLQMAASGGVPLAAAVVGPLSKAAGLHVYSFGFNDAAIPRFYYDGKRLTGTEGVASASAILFGVEGYGAEGTEVAAIERYGTVQTDEEVFTAAAGLAERLALLRTVSWVAAADGGSEITGYVVRSFDGLAVTESTVDAATLAAQLPFGTSHVEVLAVNENGRSTPVGLAL